MSPIEQAEALVAKMTRGEKAQLLQRVARDIGPAAWAPVRLNC